MPPKALLIVEDDPAVHQLLKQAISLLFERPAFFAASGEEALDMWRQHPAEIGVLLTDLNLPKMSGEELASRLVRDNPKLVVIVSTGRLVNLAEVQQKIGRAVLLLEKPFLIPDLKECLQGAFATCDATTS